MLLPSDSPAAQECDELRLHLAGGNAAQRPAVPAPGIRAPVAQHEQAPLGHGVGIFQRIARHGGKSGDFYFEEQEQ